MGPVLDDCLFPIVRYFYRIFASSTFYGQKLYLFTTTKKAFMPKMQETFVALLNSFGAGALLLGGGVCDTTKDF